MRVYFNRYVLRMKFPTGFTYRYLHGFAQFPGDSKALVKHGDSTINIILLIIIIIIIIIIIGKNLGKNNDADKCIRKSP